MRMAKTVLTVVLLMAVMYGLKAQGIQPEVTVPPCNEPPKIDGKLDDSCWKTAYKSKNFYDFMLKKDNLPPNDETTLMLTSDGNWLYFGIKCSHSTPKDMKVSIKENQGGRVFGDECVKFFINPGMKDGSYFRYVLNCKNVNKLTYSFSMDVPNMAWPSATAVNDEGWCAEVAVPLFHMAGYGDLNNIRMNVFRKKIIKEYDVHNVEVGFKEFISTWSPTDEWLNMNECFLLKGIKANSDFPFVVNAGDISIGKMYGKEGGLRYDVSMTLKGLTGAGGTVRIDVIERTRAGKCRILSKSFPLEGKRIKQVKIPVEIKALGDREIDVVVRDDKNGMPFQTLQVRDASSFELLNCRTRYNYYTSESEAELLYSIGMSEEMLKDKCLLVKKATGDELDKLQSPRPKGSFKFPLATFDNGTHALKLMLNDKAGSTLCEIGFNLAKHPPKPGHEWKIDRGAGGSLLLDGKPFFPFGILISDKEYEFEELAKGGMNSAFWWIQRDFYKQHGPHIFEEVVKRAERHGLKIIVRPQIAIESHSDKMAMLKKCFPDEKVRKSVAAKLNRLIQVKGMNKPPFVSLPRSERNEIGKEWMKLHFPQIESNVRTIMNSKGLIGYKTMDEPHFAGSDVDLILRKMYLDIKKIDPYHPMFVIYSSKIPPEPRVTSFADCLGTDPYWTPGRPLPRGSINWVSIVTAKTVARANKDGMMPWSVPQASLWSDVIKRMITPQEQICQTYLALIHGTKGIYYFMHGLVIHKEQWEALKTLASRVKVLAPALTAPRPPQEISYSPGVWDPLKDKVPDVQASLIRAPDGNYTLLAANVRISAVEVTVTVDGLPDGTIKDLFDGTSLTAKEGVFTDTLPGRSVRTYQFGKLKPKGPVKIDIKIKALGEEGTIEHGYRTEGREGMKNIQPNPSFEDTTHPDNPDYFRLLRRDTTGWKVRLGDKNAGTGVSTDKPFHGKKSVFLTEPFALYWRIAPQHQNEQPYVFSFYARTDSKDLVKVRCKPMSGWQIERKDQTVNVVGPEWKRYIIRAKAPAKMDYHSGFYLYLKSPAKVYIDGLQIERGVKPSEFQP